MTNRSVTLSTLINRDHFPGWLTERGLGGRGVEVGTYRGEWAAHVLTHWSGHLTTIDPFEAQPDETYRDGCFNGGGGPPVDVAAVESEARMRLSPWTDHYRCALVKGYSVDYAKGVEDTSLDWAYIDSNHSFEACQGDVDAWWPKIKRGGILGFHDCYNRDDKWQRCGVWDVVWTFAHAIGQQPHLTPCTSAWFLKS